MDKHIPRKRFGQHFLVDNNVIEHIVNAIHPEPHQLLVEIGAGQGALTERVLEKVKPIHVIEIDRDLVAFLQNQYSEEQLIIHAGDVLKFDFSDLITSPSDKLRIFGNLPYNISTPILFHLLQYSENIDDLIFMLQKEVVDRMAALPSTEDYGRLSVMIQYACQVVPLFDIPPSAFSPPPKVMSSMVKLIPYSQFPHPVAKDYKLFADIVNHAFQHRRKTLKNAIERICPIETILACGLDPKQRPETVSVEQYVTIANFQRSSMLGSN
jgi:16S rRNA (adenine1518-N6/adenine1519-N6)-dimethyltransferase